ncbi:hypothetical protein AC249_AIPGENE4184 [Exaiptasia diaphana]|nr:hypothetical protein AC249_AIPGENE4184 [Exaiptasia diaphana]
MAKVVLKISDISDSSEPFYNVRLCKMYIELYGEGDITKKINNLPAKVRLKVQRQSASYFKDGAGKAREFRQSLTDWRKFDFNRFAITDENECKKANKKGKNFPQRSKMNVWVYFVHWTRNYPKGPDDPRCNTQDQPKDQYSNGNNSTFH